VTAQLSRLPAALVSLDGDGLIVASNDRARALLGTDATGVRLDSIALELDAPSIRAALANDAATDNLFVHFYTPTRQIVAVDVCLGPAPATAGDVCYAVLGDARPRLENEREYEQRAGTLAFVAELAELFAGELDAQRGFERAIALVREYVPAVGVAIARADRDGRVVALVGARGVAPTALSPMPLR